MIEIILHRHSYFPHTHTRNVCRSNQNCHLTSVGTNTKTRFSVCVCRVCTEVHMSPCPVLFISFCIRHRKKFLTQRRFMSHVHICSFVCPQESQRDRRSKLLVWSRHTPCDCSLSNAETYIGLGRMCNKIVCPLGSDSMLCQHSSDVNSWHSCLRLLFCTLFPCICLPLERSAKTPNPQSWGGGQQ